MCLSDLYHEREPLPGLVTFPAIGGIQDVMGFRLGEFETQRENRDSASIVCSSGMWEGAIGQWTLRLFEREYCRVVKGRVGIADQRGRHWEFAAGSAFLLLRGFQGAIEVLEPTQIVFVVFSLPDGGALDWCMTAEGRTALGRDRFENGQTDT